LKGKKVRNTSAHLGYPLPVLLFCERWLLVLVVFGVPGRRQRRRPIRRGSYSVEGEQMKKYLHWMLLLLRALFLHADGTAVTAAVVAVAAVAVS
jgi:hypothetical protein